MDAIVVRGARTHNLQSIDVDIPRQKLVVITGPSGSGKSSLAFNTIYAEGRRRYVESLSVYARQLLGPLARPEVDLIDGLSPAIAIEQRTLARNPRSTVGTVTEIDDYLRLLFARAGVAHCPSCGRQVKAHTVSQIVDAVMALGAGARVSILAPAVREQKGGHETLVAGWRREGFVRARVDGQLVDLAEDIVLDPRKAHSLDLVIDRLSIKDGVRARALDAVEIALRHGGGLVRVVPGEGDEVLFSERFACAECGVTLPLIEPQLFSFNSPKGACQICNGLGVRSVADVERMVPDPALSLREGALAPFRKTLPREIEEYARSVGVDLYAPWKSLHARARDEILHGDGDSYPGALVLLDRRARARSRLRDEEEDVDGEEVRDRFRLEAACDACGGRRLRPEALAIKLGERNISECSKLSVRQLGAAVDSIEETLDPRTRTVVDRVLREIRARVSFLESVGLPYLSLERAAATLSNGEGQRVRLATQIGSALVGVLYVLDEPSIGLHPRDGQRLLTSLRALVNRGNSVLVVEHDLETIRAADWIVDLGPAAGVNGGRVVATGSPADLTRTGAGVTGPYLSGAKEIRTPTRRRTPRGELGLRGATLNNLQITKTAFPVGCMVAVTGVSGSGKSSLVLGTLLPAARAVLAGEGLAGLPITAADGFAQIDRVVAVDAAPIGRTPRSSPATYTGIFTALRELFSNVPEARARGFKPGRFSFNVKGGRCETCQGEGVLRVEMHFLPDVVVACEACNGSRYERETLEVRYRGFSVADVLDMTADQAVVHFEAIPKIRDALLSLHDVGLGYVHLGQPATTLSGGEAQRIKLARELARRSTGSTLYILDEPTTGLHISDIETLLELLSRLVDQGNTVVVIEHNMDVVKCADWVIDVGPEGGAGGGKIVAAGTPEAIAKAPGSYTASALAAALGEGAPGRVPKRKSRTDLRAVK